MTNPFETIDARLSNIENLLLDLKHTPKDPGNLPEADKLLNIQQAAELLNLSVTTVYTKVHKAELPVCKRSHRLYFSKQDLMDYVKAGRKKTVSEIAAEAKLYKNHKKK
ncbi:MAG: helix-turn-helix domain-containing protein [Bacteroidia bacterium]